MEKKICDEASRMGMELARYRLWKDGGIQYFAKHMNNEELSERRIYMRKALRNYPKWESLSNEELNDSGYIPRSSAA